MSKTNKAAGRPAAPVDEDPNATVVCSSPPCFMHELDPAYLGYLSREEVSALLGALLATEWGGGGADEQRLRAALRRHLAAQGGSAGGAPGTPPGEAAARGEAAPGRPPDGGPARLARAVRDALPRVHDDGLRRDLGQVLGALERDAPVCERPPGGG